MPPVSSFTPGELPDPNRRVSKGALAAAFSMVALFAAVIILCPPLADASKKVELPQWAYFFGRFHPIAVHLPVGILLLAGFLEFLSVCSRPLGRALRPAVNIVLGAGVVGAIITVMFGIILSYEGGYTSETFRAHQFLGLATAVAAIVTFFVRVFAEYGSETRLWVYRGVLAVTLLVMSFGGHLGGNMIHGDKYLIQHAPKGVAEMVAKTEDRFLKLFEVKKPADAPVTPPTPVASPPTGPAAVPPLASASGSEPRAVISAPTVYAALVAPLLESKCNSCHNEAKSKGDLRLDTHDLILKGGENGDNVIPGEPDKSLMITRMLLPIDDEDGEHMPPEGKPQPTADEIALLSWWVKDGASKEITTADPKFPEQFRSMAEASKLSAKGGSAGSSPPVLLTMAVEAAALPAEEIAVAEAMKKINGSGASLAPIAQGSKELVFSALNVAADFTDERLSELEPVAGRIVQLNLAKTKVTDAGLGSVAKMAQLRQLHLENTAITDSGIAQIKGLAHLEYLNVFGTKVTDKVFAEAEVLPKLKSLFVWQTGVTKPAALAFKEKRPAVSLNTGWEDVDAVKPKTAPVVVPALAVAAAPAPAPAPAEAKAPTGALPEGNVFTSVITPILEAKCVSCHGAEKGRGKLRVHNYADLMKGGSDGATTVIAGNAKDSLLLVRAHLPLDDDEHMPPSDEPQLTKEEVEVLTWWIAQGASETVTVAAANKTPEIENALKAITAALAAAPKEAQPEGPPKPKPLSDEQKKLITETATKMAALNASLMPVALDTEWLRFGCVNASERFGDSQIKDLAPASPYIVWADFARSKVTDAALIYIAGMDNLERLHLENTAITDEGLVHLARLKKLQYLNLYGTKITDKGLASLSDLKSLKKLFVWQTGVTLDAAKKLEAAIPGLVVNTGLSEADISKLAEISTPPKPAEPPKPAAPAPQAKPADAPKPAPANKPVPSPPPAQPQAVPAAPAKPAEAPKPAPPKPTPAPVPAKPAA